MKKTKFAVLLTAFMAVLGLSSCLGEPDPYNTVTEVMKVNNFMGLYSFSSIYGYTVEPNDQSLFTTSINNEFARVTYKYDTRTLNLNSENNKIDADILYLAPIDEIKYAYETIEANTGMYKVSSSASFFDKVNMFLDLTYYYEYSSDNDDLKEELAKHSFYLSKANAEDDEDVKDGTVVLYLNHVVSDPENNDDRKNYGTETCHFNLNYVLAGSEPDKIIIKFKQNTYSAAVDDKNAKDSYITIDYKSIVEYFNKNSNN